MGTVRGTLASSLLGLMLAAVGGCAEDEAAAPAAEPAPAPSAARPAAASAPERAAVAPAAIPEIDACTVIPRADAERIIGAPLSTSPLRASVSGEHAFASCEYSAGGGSGPRPALRLGVITERSFQSDSMTLDGWWLGRTLGDSTARKVEALDGRAWWVRLPPPQRHELLVQGRQAIYVLGSLHYGANALDAAQLEQLAEALLAAE